MKNKKALLCAMACLAVLGVGITTGGCAPSGQTGQGGLDSEAESRQGGDGGETVPVELIWSEESNCSMCHVEQYESYASQECPASLHVGVDCMTCHTDIKGLTEAHEGKTSASKLPAKLRKSLIDETLCLSCHGSFGELAERTANSTVLTDEAGTTVNPHALPESDDHDRLGCVDCHSMHDVESSSETAQNTCTSCHHTGVYACGTCH